MNSRRLVASFCDAGPGRLARAALSRSRGGYILAFHDIAPEIFESLVLALAPDEAVSLDELVARHRALKSTRGCFAITLDDGYADSIPGICAVARRRQWPATVFLPTRYLDCGELPCVRLQGLRDVLPRCCFQFDGAEIDLREASRHARWFEDWNQKIYTTHEREYQPSIDRLLDELAEADIVKQSELAEYPRALNWEQVRMLSSDLVRFESHGVSHNAVATLTDEELEQELVNSKASIEQHTGRTVNHFCYPYGGAESVGRRAPAIVARFYDSAVTMTRGRLGKHPPELLPRIPLYPADSPAVVRLKVVVR